MPLNGLQLVDLRRGSVAEVRDFRMRTRPIGFLGISSREVVGTDEVSEVLSEVLVGLAEEALDGGFFGGLFIRAT